MLNPPLWIVGQLDKAQVGVTPGVEGDKECLPMFTTRESAERFAANLRPEGAVPVGWKTPNEIRVFLDDGRRRGYTHVVIDPGEDSSRELTIEEAISD